MNKAMRGALIPLLLTAFLAAAFSGCSLLFPQPPASAEASVSASPGDSSPTGSPESVSPSPSEVIETPNIPISELYRADTIKADDGTKLVEYEAAIPLISGGSPDAIVAVNEYFKQEMEDFLFYTKTELTDTAKLNYESSKENKSSFIPCYATENYTVQLSLDNILSVSRDINFYFGSTNVDTNVKADTFDMQTGDRIIMDNIFRVKDSVYLPRLAKAVAAEIKKKGAIDAGYYEDYEKGASDYLVKENFYLTETGVVVFYPSITVAPAMLGVCRFEIPYSDLGDILADRFK